MTYQVIDPETGQVVRTCNGHAGFIEAIVLAGIGSGNCLEHIIPSHSSRVVSFSKFLVFSISVCPVLSQIKNKNHTGDSGYRFHDRAGAFVTPMIHKTGDGLRAISGDTTGAIKVWDLNTAACIRTFHGYEGHGTNVQTLALSQDGLKVRRGTGVNTNYI